MSSIVANAAAVPIPMATPRRFSFGATTVGLIVGAIGVVATLVYMHAFEQRAAGGLKILLLATTKPIARGTVITGDMVATREVPKAYVDDRAVRASDRTRIVGLHAMNNVASGQTVQWTDIIAPSDDQRDVATLVQPGNRAIPLHVEQDSLTFVQPGDFVDILGIINGQSTVLLQRVLVLAAGFNTQAVAHGVSSTTVITVSVSIAEGQLLTLAMERGHLTALLRNPNDQRVAEALPDVTEAALFDSAKRHELQRQRPASQATLPIHLE